MTDASSQSGAQQSGTPSSDDLAHNPFTTSDPAGLASLLQKEFQPPPPAVHGVVVGTLCDVQTEGSYLIALDAIGIPQAQAQAACAPALLAPGMNVAVMFLQGDTHRPLIIGPMHESHAATAQAGAAVEMRVQPTDAGEQAHSAVWEIDKRQITMQAGEELSLRCGDAAIILTSDGRILLRGVYISSQASATQRLLGGSVQIN
ncbi:DUF6484 domain-containing protein [Massilia sp. W12]|uniref:DUF6484 domain-containing protein n=1 Tax=Massilia sp. W12 TaxID=3126507 RepID=UPI0030D37ED3